MYECECVYVRVYERERESESRRWSGEIQKNIYLRLQLFAQRVLDCEPWVAKGAGHFRSFIVTVRNI